MKKFYQIYQYIMPLIFFPIAVYLWRIRLEDNYRAIFLVLSVPIIVSYIVPAVGTNCLKLWEFKTKFTLGKFRPQHGFLFGTATSLLTLICLTDNSQITLLSIFQFGFILAAVLGFWNWIYDIYAIKSKFMIVYNIRYFKGESAEAIATDYAPVYFGMFGFIYGIEIQLTQLLLEKLDNDLFFGLIIIIFYIIALIVPTLTYVWFSYLKYGELGLKSYNNVGKEERNENNFY